MNDLYQQPEKDEFKNESPIRAFTGWTVNGRYALGKGFRPSLQHLVPYLHAMESKEGWRLVQILEAATGSPSFVFRQEFVPTDDVLIERLKGDEGFKQQVRDLLHDEEPYVDEARKAGFVEAAAKMDAMREHVDSTFSDDVDPAGRGSDIDIPVEYHEEALRFIADKRGTDADRLVKDFMLYFKERNQPNQVSHKTFYQQLRFILPAANVQELKRLIDQFRVFKRSQVELTSDIYDSVAVGLGIPPDGVPLAKQETVEVVMQTYPLDINQHPAFKDDPINPKHYAGRECADIGERLSANGYQVLKYCWRLGKKDDPCQELGKAIWYAESELNLIVAMRSIRRVRPNTTGLKPDKVAQWFEDRINGQPQFTRNIARMLWAGYGRRELRAIIEAITEHRFHLDCGRGLAI